MTENMETLRTMAQTLQLATGELRQRIINYVKEAYARGEAPSLGRIRRELGVSTRRLYQLFPKGLEQIYVEAGVPAERARERLALTMRALKARETLETRGNELTAQIFERLEKGQSLTKIVVELKADPDAVMQAYEKWRNLKEIDVNQPKVLRELKSFEERLDVLWDFMEWVERSVDRRLRDDHNCCRYMNAEGYCTLWHWYKSIQGWSMKADTIEEDGKPKTVYHLNVKRHKFICTSCPSYKPREAA
jgi:AraC-like DNA-binding protein